MHWHNPGGEPMEKALLSNPNHPSPVFLHDSNRWPPATLELYKTCLSIKNRMISDTNKNHDYDSGEG